MARLDLPGITQQFGQRGNSRLHFVLKLDDADVNLTPVDPLTGFIARTKVIEIDR